MKKHVVVPRVHAGSLPGAGKAQHLSGDAAPSWLYTAPLTGDCTARALRPSQKQVFLSPQAKKALPEPPWGAFTPQQAVRVKAVCFLFSQIWSAIACWPGS